jgi:hypothetical protein
MQFDAGRFGYRAVSQGRTRGLFRCGNHLCRARRTLSKPLSAYVNPPKCLSCGAPVFRDLWQERANRKNLCCCDGYHHNHKRGDKRCFHAVGTITPEEAAKLFGGEPLDYVFADLIDKRIAPSRLNDPPF